MILTYDNVLPEDITTNFQCSNPTAKMRLISKHETLDSETKVYKLIQEIICEVAWCVRDAQLVRLDQENDSSLLAPFKIHFGRHKINHTMLAVGAIYDYQLDLSDDATYKDLDNIEFLLRRVIVDYNCLWRYHQCIVPDTVSQRCRSYASLLEYAVGVLSRFFELTLAQHQELVTCYSSNNDTSQNPFMDVEYNTSSDDNSDEDSDDSTHDSSDVSQSYGNNSSRVNRFLF